MKQTLTPQQAQVLAYLQQYQQRHGYPPTIREIAAHLNFKSPRAAQKHLEVLEAKGRLSRRPGRSRAILLQGEASPPAPAGLSVLPILGRIRAGAPSLAEQEVIGHLALDPAITPRPEGFVLQVRGDSMREAGILDGDYAVIRPQATAGDGEIVAALLGEEATLKRFYREKDAVRLEPAHPGYEPIFISAASGEFRILGKAVAIIRKL